MKGYEIPHKYQELVGGKDAELKPKFFNSSCVERVIPLPSPHVYAFRGWVYM